MDLDKLKSIFSQVFDVDINSVDDSMDTENTDSWDSLNHMKLVSAIENEFGVQLTMAEISTLETFSNVVECLESKQ